MGPLDAVFGERARVLRETNVQLLLVANAAYPMGTVYVSPMLESLVGPFATSPERIGLLITFFFAPSILVTPFAGSLADRYGRKPVLVASLLLFGIPGVAIAATTDFRLVLLLRLLQGTGAAGILPVVIASIADLYAGTTESTAQGARSTVHSLVGAALPVFAGLVVVVDWRAPFLLYGAAVPIALVVHRRFEEPTATAVPSGGPGDDGPTLPAMLAHLRDPRLLALLLAMAVPPFMFLAFLTYNSFIVVQGLGGSPGGAGVLAAVAALAGAVGGSQAGRVDAWFASRTAPLVGLNVGMFVGLGAIAMTPVYPLALVGAAMVGCGFGLQLTFYRSSIAKTAPDHLRGSLVGLAEAMRGVGATFPPVVMGVAIAVVAPEIGRMAAVRWANFGVAAGGGLLGIACVLVARGLLAGESTAEPPGA